MSPRFITTMHVFVIGAVTAVVLTVAAYHLDPYDYGDGSGELGNSLLYALVYMLALCAGFIGWIMAIITAFHYKTILARQQFYAIAYICLGLLGFAWAVWLIQAS